METATFDLKRLAAVVTGYDLDTIGDMVSLKRELIRESDDDFRARIAHDLYHSKNSTVVVQRVITSSGHSIFPKKETEL